MPRRLSEPEYQEWMAFLKTDYECDKRAEEAPSRPIKKQNNFVIKKPHVPFATEKFRPKIKISPIYQAVFVAAIYGSSDYWGGNYSGLLLPSPALTSATMPQLKATEEASGASPLLMARPSRWRHVAQN